MAAAGAGPVSPECLAQCPHRHWVNQVAVLHTDHSSTRDRSSRLTCGVGGGRRSRGQRGRAECATRSGQGREKVPCHCTRIISRDKAKKVNPARPPPPHPPAAQPAWPTPPRTGDTSEGIQCSELKSLCSLCQVINETYSHRPG